MENMGQTTHKILTEHHGEVSYTSKTPIAVWEGQVDLTVQKTCIWSNSDWRHVYVDRYAVVEIELPDWLPPGEWIARQTAWKYTWGMGVPKDWPESWQRALLEMGSAETLACIKLLKPKKLRSEFRKSLKAQLLAWIETPADERKYNTPFSPKQWGSLLNTYVRREAKDISTYLYRSR